jgi:hypothetical protein
MTESQLWQRIEAFEIDDDEAPLSFSKRLARENRWSIEYTERVIAEYKRFIFLVAISKKQITPSDQVDQAWHLHMVYTKSYWKVLCNEILGDELHHLPTQGGQVEQNRFKAQYTDTLELYQKVFKQTPPDDIWPSVEKRFDGVESFFRVNSQSHLLIPRPSPVFTRFMFILSLSVLLISCSDGLAEGGIWFWLKLVFGVYVLYLIFKWLNSGGGNNSGSGGAGCGGCTGCGGCGGG